MLAIDSPQTRQISTQCPEFGQGGTSLSHQILLLLSQTRECPSVGQIILYTATQSFGNFG